MKKILMSIVAVFAAMNMSAQVYLGGSVAFEAWSSQKLAGDKSENAFVFNPYARYTFAKLGKVNFFVDGGVDFTTASKADWTELAVGLKPGLAVNLTNNVSFVSHIGFIGYYLYNPDGDENNISKFGLNLSGSDLTFGLYFSF